MSKVAKVKHVDYTSSTARALDLIGAAAQLPRDTLLIIKPNLTNSSPPPVTTSVDAVEAVYSYCRRHTQAEIVIGEGCGSGRTPDVFARLGYVELAERHGIRLVDFNDSPTVSVQNENALQLKKFHIPKIVIDAFVISVPVLKDHSFTKTTVALKNMFGIAPSKFYAGGWNKSKLHSPSTDKSVVDVCLYKRPDLSVVDASVALKGSHLSGRSVNTGCILASFDPVAVDAVASELLGHNPRRLEYLTLANGLLGSMDDVQIIDA
ncbi:MAG: DUF362 domain-containing protein [Phycisphaerales bacterium]|nr:MAG: DUF362 domain-containing protein [Phycisphaerales bacterium]